MGDTVGRLLEPVLTYYRERLSLVQLKLLAGAMLLAFPFFIFLVSAVGFLLGIPITFFHLFIAAGITGYYIYRQTMRFFTDDPKPLFKQVVILCGTCFTLFFLISWYFYDISYDGQVYHQEAVLQLANGWNPVWQYLSKEMSQAAVVIYHYAKGPWIYEGVLYKVTGQMEGSKVFNFLLMSASFFFAWAAAQRSGKLSSRQALLVSLLCALNPVSVYQSLSFYIDGQLASLLLCLGSLAYMALREWQDALLPELVMAMVLTVNIKFTGVVYVCVGMVIMAGWFYLNHQRQIYRELILTFAIAMGLGIGLMGYSPYIVNTAFYGHPFYPLYGAGDKTMDIMTTNSPPTFLKMNMLEKLYMATFSASTNRFDLEPPLLKIPFTMEARELAPFVYGADIRIGGFGPWFGGMISLSILIWLMMVYWGSRERKYGLLAVAGILLSVLVNPEAWWARYVPQFWLVPVVTAIMALFDKKKEIVYLGKVLTIVALINVSLVSGVYFLGNLYCTQALNDELDKMAAQGERVGVWFAEFSSNKPRFDRRKVDWEEAGTDTAQVNLNYLRYNYLTAVQDREPFPAVFRVYKQ